MKRNPVADQYTGFLVETENGDVLSAEFDENMQISSLYINGTVLIIGDEDGVYDAITVDSKVTWKCSVTSPCQIQKPLTF